MLKTAIAILTLFTASAALAETNPLTVTAQTDGAWSLSFTTSVMPKGWFTERNQFDRTKTTLVAEVSALQSTCSNAAQSDARLSTADGSIVLGEVLNANGKNVNGYYWQYTNWDLTAFRNSYSIQTLCDGSKVIRGCNADRVIELQMSAVQKDGSLRTYTDAYGVAQPVAFTVTGLSLPAYHDAANDEEPSGCTPVGGTDCGIGACQSACVGLCASGQAGKDCREACECTCKVESYQATSGVCHANDKCLAQ